MSANTYGRQVVIPLTNKSGGGLIAGDVVVVDTTNNDAVTTDTSGGFTGGVAIAQETIANNATGRFLISGYAALVNVNASVTRGHFGKTHTVAKQATDAGASRGAGTFCQFLTGGTTPDAVVYPVDLLGSSLTNPMTTQDDIIVGGSSGTPTRLAKGSDSQVLTVDPTTHHLVWATPSAGGITHSYLGYNTIGGSTEVVTAHRWYAKQVTPGSSGMLLSVGVRILWGADDKGSVTVGLFEDNAGALGKLLAANTLGVGAGSVVDLSEAAGTRNPRWLDIPLASYLAASTAVWIAVMAESNTTRPTIYYDGSGSDHYFTPSSAIVVDGPYFTNTTSSNKYSIRGDFIS